MIRVRQYRSAKEVYMHFLLCMYEDFDDDILQDAIQLAAKWLSFWNLYKFFA